MPDGGHLLIGTANLVFPDGPASLREMPAEKIPAGDYVILFVTNSGVGMTPDVIARAFDPFYTTKPTGQGTGLGLSMIYGFVQQSGGHVLLDSKHGQGTTVTICLPRYVGATDGEADALAPASSLTAPASAVVLVFEDEPAVGMVIHDALADCGYMVLETDNGQSALHIVESGVRIDLLLTDVGLPGGMNGRQLADVARQRRPDLKVLFLTGYAENAAVGNSRMEQGMEVMTKPFGLEALAARVKGMIGD